MDIRRLGHFIALAEEGRFAAAAQRVHLSQAAFSRSIQTLEGRLGVRLVDRGSDGVRLTAAGTAVLARARSLVFDSDCLVRDVSLMKMGEAGELAIGIAPVAAATLLPELLVRLQRERPRVSVKLHFGNLGQLMGLLDAQQVDFCIGDPRIVQAAPERLARARIARVFGGLFCRKGHPAARRPSVDAALLRTHGVGSFTITRELLSPIARSLGFASVGTFPMAMLCDDVQLLAQVAADTDLLVILPEKSGRRANLHELPWQGSRGQFGDLHALWLEGRTLSPAAEFAIAAAPDIGGE